MLADEVDYVIGVDTHRDEHVLAVVTAPAGAVVAGAAAPSERARLSRAASRCRAATRPAGAPGRSRAPAATAPVLPATSSNAARAVLEVSRTPRTERRLRGKDDALDAARTARAALASDTLALPRAGERREALRLLLVARRSAVDVRREALTQLRAVIVTAPERLRQELRELRSASCSTAAAACAAPAQPAPTNSRHGLVLRSLARRIQAATLEADELERELLAHVRALAPALLDEPGIGPVVAAQLIVAWSHHGRLRSEACFARLAGVAPDPRLKRPNPTAPAQPRRRPPTQPRTPHDRAAPPPTRPSNQGLHRATHQRRQKQTRRHPPPQALPRPPPLPTAPTTTTDDLTRHRSFIPGRWPRRAPRALTGPRFRRSLPSGNALGLVRAAVAEPGSVEGVVERRGDALERRRL